LSFAIHHAESASEPAPKEPISRPTDARRTRGRAAAATVDKSGLLHPESRRIRDREHVRFVAQQACLVCGRQPCDAHHLRFTQNRAIGCKVSDEFTVPLCRGHHRELHRHGDEPGWWKKLGLDPSSAARALWVKMHPQTLT
jgi:hypothetical protein